MDVPIAKSGELRYSLLKSLLSTHQSCAILYGIIHANPRSHLIIISVMSRSLDARIVRNIRYHAISRSNNSPLPLPRCRRRRLKPRGIGILNPNL